MEYSKHIEQIIIASSSLLAFIIVSSAIVKVLQIVSENRIKRLLLEDGMPDDIPDFLSHRHLVWQHLLSNLKWAILLIFLALGLVTSEWVLKPDLKSPLFYGYLVLSCGFGLAIYFLLARRILTGEKNRQETKP